MRKAVLLFASTVLAVLLFVAVPASTPPTAAQESSSKPNFVFILADDMREDDLKYMPKTRFLLGEQGKHFTNAFVSYSLCCPTRATIMRGQYAHNHGVLANDSHPQGGWAGYQQQGNEQDNIATRLHDAGYRTGLFGKYFNGYMAATTAVPPGWDDWFATTAGYFDYNANDNGTIRHFGTDESDYTTDVLSGRTQQFIDESLATGKPFFAYVAPVAAHKPTTPAPRHEHAFDGLQAPRAPSFNEEDVSDKPPWLQRSPLKKRAIAGIDLEHEKRAESLLAVDDLVESVVNKLQAAGELESTYIVFTSDNGWHHGEHRIRKGKTKPYEEDIRMPLLVRGPGVTPGSTTKEMVLDTDYFPTFADLAGTPTPEYVDGRTLRPVLEGSASTWRDAILLERFNIHDPQQSYYGIRTSDGRKYIEYEGGFRELYDLNTDPYELANSYDASVPPADLATRLQALKVCAGATCRAAEDGP